MTNTEPRCKAARCPERAAWSHEYCNLHRPLPAALLRVLTGLATPAICPSCDAGDPTSIFQSCNCEEGEA